MTEEFVEDDDPQNILPNDRRRLRGSWSEIGGGQEYISQFSGDGLHSTLEATYPFPASPPNESLLASSYPFFRKQSLGGDGNDSDLFAYNQSFNHDFGYRTKHYYGIKHSRIWLKLSEAISLDAPVKLNALRINERFLNDYETNADLLTPNPDVSYELVEFDFPAGAKLSIPVDLKNEEPRDTGDVQESRSASLTAPIIIVPDKDMAGVVGDMVPSVLPSSKILHFVSPKKTTQIAQDHVILQVKGIKPEQITPGHAKQVLEWDSAVGEAVPDEPTKWRVSRAEPGRFSVKVKLKDGGDTASEMLVWIVWTEITATPGIASFLEVPVLGAKYEVPVGNQAWKFVFKILPASLLDQNVANRPGLSGDSKRDTPGKDNLYHFKPEDGSADTAAYKWDVSRQIQVKIRNPQLASKEKLQLGAVPDAWQKNQPIAIQIPVPFPADDAEANDDPEGGDQGSIPYSDFGQLGLDHVAGEIASSDAPRITVADIFIPPATEFGIEFNLRESARLEIWDGKRETGRNWFRISEFKEWHHYLDAELDIANGKWKDKNSSSGLGHPNP